MIATRAHPEHIKRHLGHSSITVTMDLYGHLLPSEADAVAQRFDDMLLDSQTDKTLRFALSRGQHRSGATS